VSLLEFHCRLHYPSGFIVDAEFSTDSSITALFGPSGSGKTTILSIIAGLRRPDHGRILFGSRTLFDSSAGIFLPPNARRVGYVFQDHLLFPHLSVRHNLLYGWKRRPRDARSINFDRVVQLLELGGLSERMPQTLSGGQRQRVALGRALLCGPQLLLLDEPLASVDEPLKKRVLDDVEQIVREWQVPTLYVTHDPEDVQRLAERVITLKAGRVTSSDPKDAAKKPESFSSC
jgi:molybdate transport system ATP-binding protein